MKKTAGASWNSTTNSTDLNGSLADQSLKRAYDYQVSKKPIACKPGRGCIAPINVRYALRARSTCFLRLGRGWGLAAPLLHCPSAARTRKYARAHSPENTSPVSSSGPRSILHSVPAFEANIRAQGCILRHRLWQFRSNAARCGTKRFQPSTKCSPLTISLFRARPSIAHLRPFLLVFFRARQPRASRW